VETGIDRPEYETELTRAAERDLDKIIKANRKASAKIGEALIELSDDPRHRRVEKLTDQGDRYRVRIGDYRVIFSIDDGRRIVTVEAIKNRRDVYRGV
jgi:mRNA interferase RelE/StbE